MQVYRKSLVEVAEFRIEDEILFGYKGILCHAIVKELTENGAYFITCLSASDGITFKDFTFDDLPDVIKIRIIPFPDGEYFHRGYITDSKDYDANVQKLTEELRDYMVVFQLRNY